MATIGMVVRDGREEILATATEVIDWAHKNGHSMLFEHVPDWKDPGVWFDRRS